MNKHGYQNARKLLPESCKKIRPQTINSPISQYEHPRIVALASSACVNKTTKIVTDFTRKDPFLHLKRAS